MHHSITGLCLVAAMALGACSSLQPPESTARAIDSDIAAAHANGPIASQLGQASVGADVIEPHSSSVEPTLTIPFNIPY